MSENEKNTGTQAVENLAETADADTDAPYKMGIDVEIDSIGPCKKHVRVKVPRNDVDHFYDLAVGELISTANIPGFRAGRVPRKLVERRFRKEVSEHVREKVLTHSLEQLFEDHELDAINEPNLNAEAITIPDEGDFEFEFDVEVRPEFELPNYSGLKIKRPQREITDAEVDDYLGQFLSRYGELEPHQAPAEAGDFIVTDIAFTHGDDLLGRVTGETIRIKPVLRFHDAELPEFDKLMAGITAGESRQAQVTVSSEADNVELRGEIVNLDFQVHEIKVLKLPEMDQTFFQQIGVDSEEELRVQVREVLDRQLVFEQRQSARTQVLEKITESADWDLPESLVRRQVENALRRETLEMQQAGFTNQEIRARENELRQNAVTTTRQALKEHFVLDRIATTEEIEAQPTDIDLEITRMAHQQGESPRRLRARLQKSGLMENLSAQVREQKAVDFVLSQATFEDVPSSVTKETNVEAVDFAVCGSPDISDDDSMDEDSDEDLADT